MQYAPIIKLLSVKNKYYLYDFNSNKILLIPFSLYSLLKKGDYSTISNNIQITHLINKGYLSNNVVKEIYNPEADYVHYMLRNHVSHLILQITQNCNMKCRYCSFATYNEYDRHHTNKFMSMEIARKAIDFLFNNSKDLHEVNIGFYGGEPLMSYENIKKCIIYAKALFKLKAVNYSLTTNGSLLNKEIVTFFEQNNVSIHISIDGSKRLQDKHRRFIHNGSATFDLINDNINMIRNNFPDYFQNYVSFISVIYPDEDINELYDYFKNLEVTTDRVNVRPVNSFGTDLKYDEKVLISSLKNSIDDLDDIEPESYSKFVDKINKGGKLPERTHPNGMCVPGRDKLYVTVNGDFFPCEKVNEENSYIKIGNVMDGFNELKIIELINLPKVTESECKRCWAFRFCEMCICHCEDYTCGISKKAKLQECENQKKKIEKYMVKYIMEKERTFL